MKPKISIILATIALLAANTQLNAEAKSYDFKDPKGVNSISFLLDAPLESIAGNGKNVSGTVSFNPKAPEATSGTITLETASLTVTNDSMRKHMLSDGWLAAETFPEITFKSKSLKNVKQTETTYNADLVGEITLKGKTKEITVPVKMTYLQGKVAERSNGKASGDLLVIRSTFKINRSEFDIKPGKSTDKVAEIIEIRLAIAGAAYDL